MEANAVKALDGDRKSLKEKLRLSRFTGTN